VVSPWPSGSNVKASPPVGKKREDKFLSVHVPANTRALFHPETFTPLKSQNPVAAVAGKSQPQPDVLAVTEELSSIRLLVARATTGSAKRRESQPQQHTASNRNQLN
jgi:hypothetical protein